MADIALFPVSVFLPVTAIGINVARVTLPVPHMMQQAQLIQISGSLQALTTGPFTVEVRRKAGALLATLTWNAAGDQIIEALNDIFDQPNGGPRFDVTALGVGALNCYVTAWFAAAM
jgi:hypothetical protein